LDGCGAWLVALMLVLISGFPLSAYALPAATATAGVLCHDYHYEAWFYTDHGSDTVGPQPFGVSDSCQFNVSYSEPNYAVSPYSQGSVNVSATFGNSLDQIGSVQVTSSAFNLSQGYGTQIQGYGETVFYLDILAIKPAPFDPASLSLIFKAKGEGTVTRDTEATSPTAGYHAYAGYYAYAQLADTVFQVEGALSGAYPTTTPAVISSAFDQQGTVWLAPNDPFVNPYYIAKVGAGCSTSAEGWYTGFYNFVTNRYETTSVIPQHVECTAMVDPIIGFDQAAFDALYGANSFTLAEYYSLGFNAGVVPVPSAVWLLGSGLLGLVAVARRRTSLA
jgi:hypothetical protein